MQLRDPQVALGNTYSIFLSPLENTLRLRSSGWPSMAQVPYFSTNLGRLELPQW